MSRVLRLLAVVVSVTGCSTQVTTTGLSKACKLDGDCVPVFEGDICEPCLCENVGVANTDYLTYWDRRTSARRWCGPISVPACKCPGSFGHCTAGVCTRSLI